MALAFTQTSSPAGCSSIEESFTNGPAHGSVQPLALPSPARAYDAVTAPSSPLGLQGSARGCTDPWAGSPNCRHAGRTIRPLALTAGQGEHPTPAPA